MKILLTSNKTYRNQLDGMYWYVYLPLVDMGHDVYFYDTVNPEEKNYSKVVEKFKPDLIFCCFTGDRAISPYEPWEEISKETESGRTKTFNWYCDDTWRFDTFSKKTCHYFTVCSTPERSSIVKYKENGYDNIIEANWHSNAKLYKNVSFEKKTIPISFAGAITHSRKIFFNVCDTTIQTTSGVPHSEMLQVHSNSKIGLNLSKNDNDPKNKTQMKQRLFEVVAGNTLLLTEHHDGLERYFKIDKEIVTFKSIMEFKAKSKFLLSNDSVTKSIAQRGYERFIKEHESSVRLKNTLQEIMSI